ncbi:MAG: putative sulfate exporter family transporter [Rhodobacteraceae bacterium]|nr:putative sulfate exporter family transporter [Paracoccaceae bacterium]
MVNAARRGRERLRDLGPGLLLAAAVATAAELLAWRYGAPATLFALLIGIGFHFAADGPRAAPGLAACSGPLLRVGVALLGFRVEAADVAALGPVPFLGVAGLTALTFAGGVGFARLAGLPRRFGLLAGGAVAICGASAALAIAALLPRREAEERDLLYTLVAITALSSAAMVAYPLLFAAMGLDEARTGFLIGATIHDVAQVAAAGYGVGEGAGDAATLVKLERVMLLPAALVAVAWLERRGAGREAVAGAGTADTPSTDMADPEPAQPRPRLPLFVFGFAACLGLNSLGIVPEPAHDALRALSSGLLVLAIAALGARTSLRAMGQLGAGRMVALLATSALLLGAALAWAALAL